MTPYEVIAGPFELYVAPVGTSFPDVDDDPTAPWVLLGVNGSKNQDESGVVVNLGQSLSPWTPAGSTLAQKVFRTAETVSVECKLADMSADTFAAILNDATVTTTGASLTQPATSSIPLKRGLTVATFALLARGLSPAGDGFNAQFQVPIVYDAASQKPAFVKGSPALLDVMFSVLEDATAGAGELIIQTEAHS